jgi:hypothetical protein
VAVVICNACGNTFPDDQTGTPREHREARCRELMMTPGEFHAMVRPHIVRVLVEAGMTLDEADALLAKAPTPGAAPV